MSTRLLRTIVFAIAAGFVAMFLVLAYLRLAYPYEVEWMEGAMLDHSIRILESKPIYTAPSIDFVAWLYPPIYYYAVAGVMKLFGIGFFAGRMVSFVSTLLTAGLLGWIVHSITKKNALAVLTVPLYLATYHASGFYFDIVRNDALFTLLLVAAASMAISFDGKSGAIVSAVLMTLAFLTKQQAIFFFPPLVLWFWMRSKRASIVFSCVAIGLSLLVLLFWNGTTHGWLFYYMFKIPSAKRSEFSWLRTFGVFPQYVFGMFAVSSIAFCTHLLLQKRTNQSFVAFWSSNAGLLFLLTLAGLAAAAISLGNDGGYANVLMPFVAFLMPTLPLAIDRIETTSPQFSRYTWLALLFQFVALSYNPASKKMAIASAHQRAGGEAFTERLRAMSGEVLIPYHGFISRAAGKSSHANILAFDDVLLTHDSTAQRLQSDFDSMLARHRFSAIIMDECPLITCDSVAHYTLRGRMIDEPNVMLARFGDNATRPEYIFVPK